MPKISETGCYSNRHLRRLRHRQTTLEMQKCSFEDFPIERNYNDTNSLNLNNDIINAEISKEDNTTDDESLSEIYNPDNYSKISSDSDNDLAHYDLDTTEYSVKADEEKQYDTNSTDCEDSDYSIDFDFEDEEFFNISDSDSEKNFSLDSDSDCFEEESEEKMHEGKSNKFKTALINWALLFNIPHVAVTALLVILSLFTTYLLPRTARTLLRTPKTTETIVAMSDGGEYLHLGLQRALNSIIEDWKYKELRKENLDLLVNIDGLPIYKSSRIALWLILCSETTSENVHLIGAYAACHHPKNANEFLSRFVEEAKLYCKNGIPVEDRIIQVNISLICDAPAKSFALNVKGHTGYDCCPKCKVKGEGIQPNQWRRNKRKKRRVCFPGIGPFAERTDKEFAKNAYLGTYQKNKATILTEIPRFGAVSNVLIDYMHLVLLGIMKKIILLWIWGPPNVRLNQDKIDKISIKLMQLRKSQPTDFCRRPRSLRDVKFWKATEFRNFLLYCGPIVLKNILPKNMFENFMSLHVSMLILVSPIFSRCQENITYAQELIEYFLQTFQVIYGKEFMSYNFHNLLHLCKDVETNGHVDRFSAFKFENFMTSIKRKLRKNSQPLQQLSRRYVELEASEKMNKPQTKNNITLKHSHYDGPLMNDNLKITRQYKTLNYGSFHINCDGMRDNCVLFKDGSISNILNIVESEKNNVYFIGKKCLSLGDLYETPCSSNDYNVHEIIETNNELSCWKLSELETKFWKIPTNNMKSAVFPLLHIT